jgi:DNA-binding NtrC family response regulator
MCDGSTIGPEHLPEEVKAGREISLPATIEIPDEGINLEKLEEELILKALEKAQGNIAVASRYLKMPYYQLYFRVRKLKEKGYREP